MDQVIDGMGEFIIPCFAVGFAAGVFIVLFASVLGALIRFAFHFIGRS